MDTATVTGLILGLAVLVASLLLGGVPPAIVLQPEAIVIVLGGTLTALLIHFSFGQINTAFSDIRKALREEEVCAEDIVDYMTDAAIYIRTKGLLAVQPLLAHVDIPFLQKGLQLIVDNQPPEYLEAQLTTDMEIQYRKDMQSVRVFEAAGGLAPTMGIIGAIVGLIQVMNAFQSPEQLGHGVACAFIATLYGVGIANMFLLPLAGKLKHRAKTEWFLKSMMLQGLIAIRHGENPSMVRERLEAFLRPAGAAISQQQAGDLENPYPELVNV